MNLKQLLAICNIRHSHNRMRFSLRRARLFLLYRFWVCVWLMPLFQVAPNVSHISNWCTMHGESCKIRLHLCGWDECVRVCVCVCLSSCEYKFERKSSEKNTAFGWEYEIDMHGEEFEESFCWQRRKKNMRWSIGSRSSQLHIIPSRKVLRKYSLESCRFRIWNKMRTRIERMGMDALAFVALSSLPLLKEIWYVYYGDLYSRLVRTSEHITTSMIFYFGPWIIWHISTFSAYGYTFPLLL